MVVKIKYLDREWLKIYLTKNQRKFADFLMERVTGFEPAIFSLARRHSTTELHPPTFHFGGGQPAKVTETIIAKINKIAS